MDAEPLAAGAEVACSAEDVRADEHALGRPPERDLSPAAAHADRQELERPERLLRHDVMRDAESVRERGAVAVVPVEELDDSGRRSRGTDALLQSVHVDRIDKPDAAAGHERVGAALHELVRDPAEAGVGLVYRFHIAAQRSKPGKSSARAAAISSSTSNGIRRNSSASVSSSTSAYSLNGSNGTSSSGPLCS